MHFEHILEEPTQMNCIPLGAASNISLGEHDLVILNHGPADGLVNNGALGTNWKSPGLERVFRKFAESRAFHLVVLDSPGGYRQVYSKYAKDYNITTFNYDYVVRRALIKGHRMPRDRMGTWPHIPWQAQQLLADAVAMSLSEVAQSMACNTTKTHLWDFSKCHPRKPSSDNDALMCDFVGKHQKVSFLSYRAIGGTNRRRPLKNGTALNGRWAGTGSWRLVEDRFNKPGWVTEAVLDSDNHMSPGGVISFWFSKAILWHNGREMRKSQLLLNVGHMQTWIGAGWADLIICGKKVARLDALWSLKASEMVDRVFPVPISSCGLYYNASGGLVATRGDDMLRVDLVHTIPRDANVSEGPVRSNLKFKLERIDVCAI